MNRSPERFPLSVLGVVAGTLAAWLAFAMTPALRVWGPGFLSPLDIVPRAIVVTGVAVLCVLVIRGQARYGTDDAGTGKGSGLLPLWAALTAAAIFVVLADRTHFLGDGGAGLEALSKQRLRGGLEFRLAVPLWQAVQSLWGGESGALRAHQTIAVFCGAVSVYLAVYHAHRIFAGRWRAWAFALGLLTAGYMLVFFGYVGDQALLVLAVIAFVCTGTACARQRAGIAGALVAFLLAVLAHPLGWTLVPALLYLCVTRTPLAPLWRAWPRWLRTGLGTALVAVLVGFVAWLQATDAGFRLALVPLLRNRLTVDGYTLFSVAHLLDLANLALLLLPGLPVALTMVWASRREPTDAAHVFLAWSAALTGLAVCFADPPLGMPRSWDRLAFAAVPLAAWMYYRLLSVARPRAVTAALVCASLSLGVLFARAWTQSRPEPAVRQAMSYFELDPARSRTGVLAVGTYLLDRNTTAVYGELEDFRRKHYPEEAMRVRLNGLFKDNKQLEAADVCQQIIRRDPRYAEAWMFLGFIYNNAGRFDSATAYLTVADGLAPHNPATLNELGRALYFRGDADRAAELWYESLAEDSLQYVPRLALATWHKAHGRAAEASRQLTLAAARPDAPGATLLELARDHAEGGRFSEARAAYEEAVARGVDTANAALLLKDYPTLGPPVTPQAEPR